MVNRFLPLLFSAVITCYTYSQVRDAECKLYCRLNTYDSGLYVEVNNRCWCANVIPDDRLLEKRLSMPKKISEVKISSPPFQSQIQIPYKFPDNDVVKLPWED
jgi:hypothetical protein